MKHRKPLFALAAVCGLCAFFCMTACAGYGAVVNRDLMNEGFMRYARTERFSVRADQYGDYAGAITDYLAGRTDEMLVPDESGGMKEAFGEKENLHMEDVRGLVRALGLIRILTGAAALGMAGWLCFLVKKKEEVARILSGIGFGAALWLLLGGVLTALALSGFDSFFVSFHKLFFKNDLWLLNPQQHLLINLMPTAFFVWYGGEILKRLMPVAALALAGAIAVWYLARMDQKRAAGDHNTRANT